MLGKVGRGLRKYGDCSLSATIELGFSGTLGLVFWYSVSVILGGVRHGLAAHRELLRLWMAYLVIFDFVGQVTLARRRLQ